MLFNRESLLEQLKDVTEWDVIIIGGGQAALALDDPARGPCQPQGTAHTAVP